MPRVRIGAAYKTGNTTGVALLQDGNKVALQVFQAQNEGATCTPTTTVIVENASSLEYAGEQTSNIFTRAEQVRILVQEMREGVQAFDVIIVITRAAIQATLQEDIPDFLQKLQEVDTSGVLGVGVARGRTSGSRMLAWITYGGPDGTGALNLGGGTLLSYFYTR
eukprot:scaffold6088_cov128-Isochrysis_galbana.AAC.1